MRTPRGFSYQLLIYIGDYIIISKGLSVINSHLIIYIQLWSFDGKMKKKIR